jgi:hypothetical protein
MSKRAIARAIISMAQQAVPKVIGHSEFARQMLKNLSVSSMRMKGSASSGPGVKAFPLSTRLRATSA